MCNDNIYRDNKLWIDPLDEPPGLLLSDRIAYYARNCDMISPFSEDDLRTSYYTLHVGDEYWIGREKIKVKNEGRIKIEPNGFVYIRVKEFLNIPFYIVASYSLCVKQVYRGLMLDNGLQIDPGYRGYIHVPVYNFTDDVKYYKSGDPFLAVEFIRTTKFNPQDDDLEGKNLNDMYNQVFEGFEEYPLKTFKKIDPDRPVDSYFVLSENNKSSVLALREDVKVIESSFIKFRNIGYGTLAALLLAVVGLLLVVAGYIYQTQNSINQVRIDAENTKSAIKLRQVELKEKFTDADMEIKELEKGRNEVVKLIEETERKLNSTGKILEDSYKIINSQATDIEIQLNDIEKVQNNYMIELQNKISELESTISKLQNNTEKRGK